MRETVISAKNIWKLFGDRPRQYLQSMIDAGEQETRGFEDIRLDGYIAGIKNVSLDVKQGEMLVVMGLSGSGKSTLVRCFGRLHDITGGELLVEGQNIMKMSERELIALRRSKMGMVFQSFGLLPHRTVLENVAFPLEMRGQDRHSRRERALEVIEMVGLAGREEYFPRELSGGQQQRVGIARSLAIEPDIWFLDEPFSALDPLIRREMQDEFLHLKSMLGKTVVFITHDFDEALRLADRIAVMKEGAVEQCDTPDKIVLHPETEYVRKFTEEINKARVVQTGSLMQPLNGAVAEGETLPLDVLLCDIGPQLLRDTRQKLPLVDAGGKMVGVLDRDEALSIILGAEA